MIAGLPVEKFLNRRIRLANKNAGHHRPATLLSIASKGKVVVRPDGHKNDETVEVLRIHPWWSQNPDLKTEHDALVAQDKTAPVEEIEVVDPPAEETASEPEEPATELIEVKLPGMQLPPGINFQALQQGVQELEAAMVDVEEINRLMRPAQARQAGAEKSLQAMGVKLS